MDDVIQNLCKAYESNYIDSVKRFVDSNKDNIDNVHFEQELESYQREFTSEFKKYVLEMVCNRLSSEVSAAELLSLQHNLIECIDNSTATLICSEIYKNLQKTPST